MCFSGQGGFEEFALGATPVSACNLKERDELSHLSGANDQRRQVVDIRLVVILSPWLAVLGVLVAASYRFWRPWLRHTQSPAGTAA
jgi:hypothetical protein